MKDPAEKEIRGGNELSDSTLGKVNGGGTTDMCCSACGWTAVWVGRYDLPQEVYECPHCQEKKFRGVSYDSFAIISIV